MAIHDVTRRQQAAEHERTLLADATATNAKFQAFFEQGALLAIIMALNGTTAGSAFQVALLADIRIAHPEVTMGQPEINSGIASITGPWIMREMLGLSRTTELSLTGRLMNADECYRIGIVHHVVPRDQVLNKAFEIADELGQKAPLAMRLNKAWLRKMTEAGFREAFDAAMLAHRISYDSGEPARMIDLFFAHRSDKSER